MQFLLIPRIIAKVRIHFGEEGLHFAFKWSFGGIIRDLQTVLLKQETNTQCPIKSVFDLFRSGPV
jgi:hypothetical protein